MSKHLTPSEVVTLYRIWTSIIYRCTKKENKQFRNYGGRGINICTEWMNFDSFCYDVGRRPFTGAHLDRIDNDRGYFKDNCRWVTAKINHRNKRSNKYYLTHVGKISQAELIEKAGYTRKQFQRAIEKYGEKKFLEMFEQGVLPKKRVVRDIKEFLGKKFGKLLVVEIDPDKSTGIRYFCLCECGKKTRASRFKLDNGLLTHCPSCSKRGCLNPNSSNRKLLN